ncbi:MAG TPA: response regulator transcription factor [Opitutaceae bacterium]|nr:response regulator transcription factor [Opitutaceae bacterium]
MNVLVLEDQAKLGQSLKRGLNDQGWSTEWVTTAESAQRALTETKYDVIVLDLMLPDRDGLDLLREWRQYAVNTPVIILSARNALRDRVDGLEYGADDYLAKPFSMEELVARIRALKRRDAGDKGLVLRHRELAFDVTNRRVSMAGKPVELTSRELELLEIFMNNIGRLVTRSMLTEKVWSFDYDVDSNLLDVYMGRLRSKLESPEGKPFFDTIRGMGYKMV